VVVEQRGLIAAMGYLIPSGEIKAKTNGSDNEKHSKCAMIYSVGTLPEYRSMGLGTVIVNNLITLAGDLGYEAVVLCPSEDGLFEYYNTRTELRDWFYVRETIFTKQHIGISPVRPVEISVDEYLTVREKLLPEIIHIKQGEKLFEYQLVLCSKFGGGLFRIGDSCAVVERQSNGVIWVKELLIPGKDNSCCCGYINDVDLLSIITPIAYMFSADEYLIRTPAKSGGGRRFGMLNHCGNVVDLSVKSEFAPWYGMAFD
jgi:hypothetical protein